MNIPPEILNRIVWNRKADVKTIKSIKPLTGPCETCGRNVTDRRVAIRILSNDKQVKHTCLNCKEQI